MTEGAAPGRTRAEIVDRATALLEDLDLTCVSRWLDEVPGRKAIGYLPVYVPRELIHAAGMLPVGLHGAGEMEIIKGDAFYQSYICHIPRSIVELLQSGRLARLSGILFPSTCDVIRNLSGVFRMLVPGLYVRYVDLPQVRSASGAAFWEGELRSILGELEGLSGRRVTDDDLVRSIGLYNELRALVREAYRLRREQPAKLPTEELARVLRAGERVPPEEFLVTLRAYLAAVEASPAREKDLCRVVLVGAFCEQPPLGLLKTIERAGCAVVDDDLLLGNRLIAREVPLGGDPIRSLARSLVDDALETSILYEERPEGKRTLMPRRVKEAGADGILFAAASFCDPALLDRPMLKAGADAAGIPSLSFQFSENTGQFQPYREQAGTFADSLKLWGGA